MKGFTGLLTLVAACLLGGCFFKVIHESDLIGEYEASLPGGGIETLELLEEGRCKQVIRLHNGATYEAEGTWKISPTRGEQHVIFKGIRSTGFYEINPSIGEPPIGAIGKIVIASWSGRPMIERTEDSYYRKVR